METKVVNKRKSRYDVYIGRGSIFGNPYSHKSGTLAKFIVKNREEAILKYKEYFYNRLETDDDFLLKVGALKGKILGCYCRPTNGFRGKLLCHGQIIAGFLDDVPPENIT
jgi:hypothetical protein